MELTEDQTIDKFEKRSMRCLRNTLLPHEKGKTCFSCGYNVIERDDERKTLQGKKLHR